MLDPLEAMLQGQNPAKLRVGLIFPLSGVLGVTGPTVIDAVRLAAHEINSTRSAGGRKVELVLVDSGRSPVEVAAEVQDLAQAKVIEACIGLHTSQTLEHVERALSDPLPYIFAAGHEGTPRRAGFYCSGETPDQSADGLRWLMTERKVSDWAIVGTEYVWPRIARDLERRQIEASGGRVVLDRLIPLGAVNSTIRTILQEVDASGAKGLIVNMPGRDLITALRAAGACGMEKRLVIFSPGSLDENLLYALNGNRSGNLYASMHSFHTAGTDRTADLNDRYRFMFGDSSPVLTSWGEHAYDGMHLLAQLDDIGALDAANLDTPGGVPRVQGSVVAREYRAHLAVAAGLSFEVIDA
ncbi:ABC transporter substrate-binding protein [Paenarthrobacter ilicis]|uniref:ABC transporter substrate-binding protein n=1 Tax=Paenarthrobacter ilicis TaxID=43665 RepID=UPI003007F9A5